MEMPTKLGYFRHHSIRLEIPRFKKLRYVETCFWQWGPMNNLVFFIQYGVQVPDIKEQMTNMNILRFSIYTRCHKIDTTH